MIETVIEKIRGEDYCLVYTGEPHYIEKLKSYDGIDVVDVGEGHVRAKVPAKWFKFVSPPKKNFTTEEQRQAAAERMRKAREARNKCK